VEGLSGFNDLLPVQKSMISCNGSQCGYCTPGFIMAMTGMNEEHKGQIDEKTVKNHLTGNLCRCTGYLPIIAAGIRAKGKRIDLIRRYLTRSVCNEIALTQNKPLWIKVKNEYLDCEYLAPTQLNQLKGLNISKFRLIAAATDLGVQLNKGKTPMGRFLSLQGISDLYKIQSSKTAMTIGARVTLSELRKELLKYSEPLGNSLNLFASPQIKNSATLVGNLANASPISDTAPIVLAMNGEIHTWSSTTGKKRKIPIRSFFISYRKTALKPEELITSVFLPLPQKGDFFRFYKNSPRKDLDISTINAAIHLSFNKNKKIKKFGIAMGGVAEVPLFFSKVESKLLRKSKSEIPEVLSNISKSITPISDLRGSEQYRKLVAKNLMMTWAKEFSE